MSFTPRPYQSEAIDAGLEYFHGNSHVNAFEILPTGSGKSVVIANISMGLSGRSVILQPSIEILKQNYAKYISYGYRAGIYSASAGSKFVDKITFATIGSINTKHHLFKDVQHILIDECHYVNPAEGMYQRFIKSIPEAKTLGFTATPYRLTSEAGGAMLTFLNRSNPRIFSKCLYYIQNDVLFNAGYLAKLRYFSYDVVDRSMLQMNSQGTDFTEASLQAYYRTINMPRITVSYAHRILKDRKNLLIFCSLLSEAEKVARYIEGAVVVSGDTNPLLREKILRQFKEGIIRCVVNVGVLTTGFDYPELEAILIARSTMSLSLYYQMCGRPMRPHPNKSEAWIFDLGGNVNFFGKIETMQLKVDDRGRYAVWNNGRQLTDVTFKK